MVVNNKIAASRGHPRPMLCHCCTENNGQTAISQSDNSPHERPSPGSGKASPLLSSCGPSKVQPLLQKIFNIQKLFWGEGAPAWQGALIHNVTPLELGELGRQCSHRSVGLRVTKKKNHAQPHSRCFENGRSIPFSKPILLMAQYHI